MPAWTGVAAEEGTYVVQAVGEHIENLARAAYGDAALWWVIAARNGLDLPDADLYPGRVLRVPSRAWVERSLLPQGR
jgi:nucleoid-associated protein YgaU